MSLKKRILFVDDEPNFLLGLKRRLRSMQDHWETQFVCGGQEALEMLAQPPLPDLIVCDINMPGLSGFSILKMLRQDPATAIIPFIFLTGESDRPNMRQGMELGADDYLTKPFETPELIAAIKTRFQKKDELDNHSEKKLDKLRQNIVLSMPHELRTPLTAIKGCSEVIIDSCDILKTSQTIEMAQCIHESSERLDRLIENYLAYAQLEIIETDSEKLKDIQSIHIDNAGEIIRGVSIQKAEMVHRAEDLILEVEDAPACISEQDLRKIVEELVDNAFKFSNLGTAVRVITDRSNNGLNLYITDLGLGMTPEQIAEIGAYMQFDRRIYEQQGSGIGLVLAKRLAELHHGKLTIESVPGKQTTVSITLRT